MNSRSKSILKNIGALFFGLFLTCLFLGGIEFFFRLNEVHHWLKPRDIIFPPRKEQYQFDTSKLEYLKNLEPYPGVQDFDDPSDYSETYSLKECETKLPKLDPYWLGAPNCKASIKLKKTHSRRVVYDTFYNYDEHALRIIPSAKKESKKFLLFLGCSFTWGEGNSDENIFPNLITKAFESYNAFNLGMAAYGPNHNLALIQNGKNDLRMAAVKGDAGIAIYTFIEEHVLRVLGTALWIRKQAKNDAPYYYLENGLLKRSGSFSTGRPIVTAIYSLLAKSAFLNYLHWELSAVTDSDLDLFVAIIKEMKLDLERNYGVKKFIFSIYPEPRNIFIERLKPKLQHEGIIVFDFSTFPSLDLSKGRSIIFGDGHPSALGHRIYSDLFIEAAKRDGIISLNHK